jgi:hypothetical protein
MPSAYAGCGATSTRIAPSFAVSRYHRGMNDLRTRAEAVVRELDKRRALPVRDGPTLIETRARGGQATNETSRRLETFTSTAEFERVRAELIAILDALSGARSVDNYREAGLRPRRC